MFFGLKTVLKVAVVSFVFVGVYSFGTCSEAYGELASDLSQEGFSDFFENFKECSKPTEAFDWLKEMFDDSEMKEHLGDKVEELKEEALEKIER